MVMTKAEKQEAALADQIQALLETEMSSVWTGADRAFLGRIAGDLAREKLLVLAEGEDREEHEQNLRHLAATAKGELMRKQIELGTNGRRMAGRIIAAVINAVALPGLVVR